MMNYNLPLPPVAEPDAELTRLMAEHDAYALQEVPTQVAILNDLPVASARELLSNLDLVRAQHEARARNIESTVNTIVQHLHMTANTLDEGRALVGTAAHTTQLDVPSPGRGATIGR